jgi:biopolymer transport protein ExbB
MVSIAWLDIAVFSTLGTMAVMWLWVLFERLFFFGGIHLQSYTTAGSLQLALTRNLTLMSTVAANAPYIGLLGTVLGIMVALYDVGMAGSMDPSKIMVGLALALKATAAGIVLAVVAMMSVNLLMRQVDVLIVRWQDMQGTTHAH